MRRWPTERLSSSASTLPVCSSRHLTRRVSLLSSPSLGCSSMRRAAPPPSQQVSSVWPRQHDQMGLSMWASCSTGSYRIVPTISTSKFLYAIFVCMIFIYMGGCCYRRPDSLTVNTSFRQLELKTIKFVSSGFAMPPLSPGNFPLCWCCCWPSITPSSLSSWDASLWSCPLLCSRSGVTWWVCTCVLVDSLFHPLFHFFHPVHQPVHCKQILSLLPGFQS